MREVYETRSPLGALIAVVAGYLVAALIGCAPILLPLLPAILVALPIVYAWVVLLVFPISVVIAWPLYLLVTRYANGNLLVVLALAVPGVLVFFLGAALEAATPAAVSAPAVNIWVAASVVILGGPLTLVFNRPGARGMTAATSLISLGVVGWLLIFWMTASSRPLQ